MISHILDHATRAVARLLAQYRGKARLEGLIAALGAQVQELEDAFQQLLTLRRLDSATGAQLDVLGKLVGQPRGGVTDDTVYRAHITARIGVNRSHGTIPEILATIVPLVLAEVPGADVTLVDQYPAAFVVRIAAAATTQEHVDFLLTFLRPMKPAGVRGLLEWQPVPTADVFTWEGTADQAWDNGTWANAVAF